MGESRGLNAGGLWMVGLCLIVVLACIGGLVLTYGITDSQSNRAQARASEANAQAAAAAAVAQGRVDEVRAQEEGQTERLAEEHEFRIELSQQQNREFQERLILLVTVLQGMDEERFDRLMAQLDGKQDHPPAWWAAVAAVLAGLVFVLGLLGWRIWKQWKGWEL